MWISNVTPPLTTKDAVCCSSQARDSEARTCVLCMKDVDYAEVGFMCVHDGYGKSKCSHYARSIY
jgi:hypothetical protein